MTGGRYKLDNDGCPIDCDWTAIDLPTCPVCDAGPGDQCTESIPDRPGFAAELGAWVHVARLEAWEEGAEEDD